MAFPTIDEFGVYQHAWSQGRPGIAVYGILA